METVRTISSKRVVTLTLAGDILLSVVSLDATTAHTLYTFIESKDLQTFNTVFKISMKLC